MRGEIQLGSSGVGGTNHIIAQLSFVIPVRCSECREGGGCTVVQGERQWKKLLCVETLYFLLFLYRSRPPDLDRTKLVVILCHNWIEFTFSVKFDSKYLPYK
jgi:hypothetical protein